jgi:hypothetical protein
MRERGMHRVGEMKYFTYMGVKLGLSQYRLRMSENRVLRRIF